MTRSALQIENELLRKRVEELEDLCGITEARTWNLPVPPGLSSGRIATVVQLLLKRDLVTRLTILTAFGADERVGDNMADVYICRTRKLLATWEIPLCNDWSRGWYVERKHKDALRKRLAGDDAAHDASLTSPKRGNGSDALNQPSRSER